MKPTDENQQAGRKPPQRVNLSRHAIDAIPVPATGRVYVFDAQTPGLAVCRTSTGATSFYRVGRINGRPVRIRIAGFPEISVEKARRRCAELSLAIANGQNPHRVKQAAREETTLGQLFNWFMETHSRPKKRTADDDQKQFDRYLKPWAGRQLSTIDTGAVRALHARIGTEHGKYSANRLLALLHAMFRLAVIDKIMRENPAAGISKFPEESRERFLSPEEMPKFMAALEAEPDTGIRDALKMCLWTGARKSNVLAARWDEIDLRGAVWTIPAGKAKAGKSYSIPLSPVLVELLQQRRAATDKGCPWVFPSSGKTGHLVEIKAAWKAILARAGLENLRVHDLRRTAGSWMAAAGTSLPVIGKTLGHSSQAATAVYARLALDPVRLALNQAVAAMQEAATLPPDAPAPPEPAAPLALPALPGPAADQQQEGGAA